jgi:hypothetical protein
MNNVNCTLWRRYSDRVGIATRSLHRRMDRPERLSASTFENPVLDLS